MNSMEAFLWITRACMGMRKSQIKTLGDLVGVRTRVGRVSLSGLGRLLAEEQGGVPNIASGGRGGSRRTSGSTSATPCRGRCDGFSTAATIGRTTPCW